MEAGALRAPAALNRITVTSTLLRLRSDEQLVALFREGNDAAFAVIHDRYRQRLFAYTRQMLGGSRQDAEDALQDVFLRAYSALRAHDRPVSLRAWLYRVAHNRCIDQLRKPVPAAADVFDLGRKPLHDPIAEAERREDLRRLVADLRRLPEQQRSALLMREIDGLSYAELAVALDVTVPAVKSLLVRARIGLVEAIEARDTACADIRDDLINACDRGVRMSGRARRHMRDCSGCSEYRAQLRGLEHGLGALMPAGPSPLAVLAKILGIGGAGSGAAASAGGGAAAGSGALALAGTGTAAKVAAIVCCAALTAGGAVEMGQRINAPATVKHTAVVVQHVAAAAPAALPGTSGAASSQAAAAVAHRAQLRRARERAAARSSPADDAEVISPHADPPIDASQAQGLTGGVLAPYEDPDDTTTGDTLPQADATGQLARPTPIQSDSSATSASAPAATAPATTPTPAVSAHAASPPVPTAATGGTPDPAASSGGTSYVPSP